MFSLEDTIVAVASAPGGAARAIVRMSGPQVVNILGQRFSADDGSSLIDVRIAQVIPGLLDVGAPLGRLPGDLWLWPNSRSYTRQPTAEFHTFGSPPLAAATVRALCESGARPAEPGEFTLRAFLAGRLDLTQAEAVLGVIDARGRSQLDAALAQLAGGMSRPLAALRESLLELLAHLEAGLDFVEEDIQFIERTAIATALDKAAQDIRQLLTQLDSRSASSELPKVVLVGLPNVGKSSLFNALASRSAAIVSNQPGTTRDYLSARVTLGGLECELIDTAGLESELPRHPIDQSAQLATADQRDTADLTILCLDSGRPLQPLEQRWLAQQTHLSRRLVLTKCDGPRATNFQGDAVETSATSGVGIDHLAGSIKQALSGVSTTGVAGTAERCRESLRLAIASLEEARHLNATGGGEELIAAELRNALGELGKVVGAVYTDDILDRIFSRFCIGK
jgi:tRNA modification GTPase